MPTKFQRKRFQSQRLATTAVRKVRSELPAHLRSKVSTRIRTTTDQAIRRGFPQPAALASVPALGGDDPTIRFMTTASGELAASRRALRGVARHEAAHLLGARHPAIAAAGKAGAPIAGGPLSSGTQVLQAASFERSPSRRRRAILRAKSPARGGRRSQTSSTTQGFQTPHLVKESQTGSSMKRRRSRDLMRKLGRRLKGKMDF